MQRWEYLLVRVESYAGIGGSGWAVRYENGMEIRGWKNGPSTADYINQRGDERWELISYAPIVKGGSTDYLQIVLKRPKP